MVDVGRKARTRRRATATATVRMRPATRRRILAGTTAKGPVLETARLAGMLAAKRTAELIPLCHPLPLTGIDLAIVPQGDDALVITATVTVSDRTGVEMEALTAVSVAALTVYDMAKAIDRGMTITDIGLLAKSGGRSGPWRRR